MIFLGPSVLTLVALVQNVFYVYTPPEIDRVFVQLDSETASTNGTWNPLLFKRLKKMPLFFTRIPGDNIDYLHFKLRVHFINGTTSHSTSWTSITSTKLMNNLQTNGIILNKQSDVVPTKRDVFTLVALVNNTFYVCAPPGINRLFVQLGGQTALTHGPWTPLLFQRLMTMPLFFISIPGNSTDYLHYRLRVYFVDGTSSQSTSWATITSTNTLNEFQTNETTEKFVTKYFSNIILKNKSGVVRNKENDFTNIVSIQTNQKGNAAKDNQSVINSTKLKSNQSAHGGIVKAVVLTANGVTRNNMLFTLLYFLAHLPVFIIN